MPKAAPAVGADTDSVLHNVLKYDEARIEQLRAAGAFGTMVEKVAA